MAVGSKDLTSQNLRGLDDEVQSQRRDASRAAKAVFLALKMEHRDRRIVAEPFGVPVNVAVQHEIADQDDFGGGQVLN